MLTGRVLAILAAAVLLAGCGDDPTPGDAELAESPDAGPPESPTTEDNEPPATGVEVVNLTAVQRYTFDLTKQDYAESLTRYAIVADGAVKVEAEWTLIVGLYEDDDDCAVAAESLEVPGPNGTTDLATNAFAVSWAASYSGRAAATYEGTSVGSPTLFSDIQSSGVRVDWQANYNLTPGARLIIEMGGRSTDYARGQHLGGSGENNNTWVMEYLVTGPSHLEVLPSRSLLCGVGPHQADGTLKVDVPTADVAQDTSIAFTSTEASTALADFFSLTRLDQAHLDFLGQRHTPRSLSGFATADPGDMKVVFDLWGASMYEGTWLMADTYWPAARSVGS